jgi:hypothetical protein
MMAGCKSCSDRSPDLISKPIEKAEKLEKVPTSGNPRYPHIFVGSQAIFTNCDVQLIVSVEKDDCDEQKDCFRLKPLKIIKDKLACHAKDKPFDVEQSAGEKDWRLHALI